MQVACSSKPTLPSWQRVQNLLARQAMLNFACPKGRKESVYVPSVGGSGGGSR